MFAIIIPDSVAVNQVSVVLNAINVWMDTMDFLRKDVEVIYFLFHSSCRRRLTLLQTSIFDFLILGCDECHNSAFICDSESGRCVCPELSKGSDCQQCYPNSWGWEHRKGCKVSHKFN